MTSRKLGEFQTFLSSLLHHKNDYFTHTFIQSVTKQRTPTVTLFLNYPSKGCDWQKQFGFCFFLLTNAHNIKQKLNYMLYSKGPSREKTFRLFVYSIITSNFKVIDLLGLAMNKANSHKKKQKLFEKMRLNMLWWLT